MNVFAYGSLMFPPVWARVVRGVYRQAAATACGYRRLAVKGETYPGMVEAPGERVEGIVYFDVDATDLDALDAFEGADYRRVEITIDLLDDSTVNAQTYLFLPAEKLGELPWLSEGFPLQIFLDSYCNFTDRKDAPCKS